MIYFFTVFLMNCFIIHYGKLIKSLKHVFLFLFSNYFNTIWEIPYYKRTCICKFYVIF